MLDNVLSFFGLGNEVSSTQAEFRRKGMRHSGLNATLSIGENTYAVHDWDMKGIAFETTPETYLEPGADVQMSITFNLSHETIVIEQSARTFRMVRRGISVALFTAMTPFAHRQFQRVLDGLYAQEFLKSQVA